MRRRFPIIALILLVSGLVHAQDTLPTTTGAPRAVAFALSENGLVAAEVTLPDNTLTIDFNPQDTTHWARTDQNGMIRYAPLNTPEGVYTFAPYQDGFSVGAAGENKLFVQQVAWSPNGQQLGFVINTPNFSDEPAHGVWFWQPARETANDPAYQLLRQCPPRCELTNNVDNLQWHVRRIDWSPDSTRVLVGLDLPQEGRRALAVRVAARDADIANTPPQPLRYDTGHWTLDGSAIVVAGSNPQGVIGFGIISPEGNPLSFTPVAPPVAAWVQDAVQGADGQFYMFGSAVGRGAALQLLDSTGRPLTPEIGSSAPDRIRWNSSRTAALLNIGSNTFVVQVDGTITDVTSLLTGIRADDWVASLPTTGRVLTVPEPLVTGGNLPVKVGDILRVNADTVAIYAEPTQGAVAVGLLNIGEELVIVGDAVQNRDIIWWRIQSIHYSGWINTTSNLELSPLDG